MILSEDLLRETGYVLLDLGRYGHMTSASCQLGGGVADPIRFLEWSKKKGEIEIEC